MPDSPEPPRRAGLSVTVSPAEASAPDALLAAPAAGGDRPGPAGAPVPVPAPAVAGRPESPEKPGDASGAPEEPVKSSVVSLTRGPSQGAGGGRCGGRSTRCHDPANRPGQVLRVLLSPH